MKPCGRCTFNIIYRADLDAFATLDTYVGIDCKLAVCYHLLIEVAANHIGVKAGSGALLQFFYTLPTILDDIDDMHQLLSGLCNLFQFFLFWISVHKRQTYI